MFREIKFLKNAGWLLVLQAVNILLPFITIPYVTRVFGAETYGVFSIALNWVTYFQLVIEFGFDLSATKKVAEKGKTEDLGKLVSAVVFARLFLVLVCLAATVGLALTSAVDNSQLMCMLVLFSMLIGYAIQLNWLFLGLQDMKIVTISTAIARALSVALIFLMIHEQSQLALYSLLYSITYLLSGVLTHVFARNRYGIALAAPKARDVVSEMRDGMPIFLSNAAGKIIGNVGVTVLGACQPAAVVGSYAAILKIPQMVNLMFSPISQALYPRVNEERMRSRDAAKRLVGKIAVPILLAFALGLAVLVAIRIPIVSLLFGDEYVGCANTLIPLAVWVLLGIANNFLGVQLLIPFGYQRLYSALIVTDSFLSLLLNVLMGHAFGAIGVAAAIAISEAVLTIALAIALRLSRKLES